MLPWATPLCIPCGGRDISTKIRVPFVCQNVVFSLELWILQLLNQMVRLLELQVFQFKNKAVLLLEPQTPQFSEVGCPVIRDMGTSVSDLIPS